MSGDEATTPSAKPKASATATDSPLKMQTAVDSLSSIVPSLSKLTPASLLTSPDLYSKISALLRQPNSGAGDNNLCRWLYDTFQSGVVDLQLLVLRFLPVIAGVYLSRVADRKPQAGFEAVLLALYAYETTSRAGKPVSITIPDLSQPSVYHEATAKTPGKGPANSAATDPEIAVVSPRWSPTAPCGPRAVPALWAWRWNSSTRRSGTCRCPQRSIFASFARCGQGKTKLEDGGAKEEEEGVVEKKNRVEGRVPLSWELLQPVMRILGHCLLGPNNNKDVELCNKANEACRSLFSRSMHDVNPKAILPMRSLLRLSKTVMPNHPDPTELPFSDVISL
ncbi:hypothetical protein ACSQ67_017099 [Phaseolus vulgaris]